MSVYVNASQHLGLGAQTSIALADIAKDWGIRLDPKDLRALSETVVREILAKGEKA